MRICIVTRALRGLSKASVCHTALRMKCATMIINVHHPNSAGMQVQITVRMRKKLVYNSIMPIRALCLAGTLKIL